MDSNLSNSQNSIPRRPQLHQPRKRVQFSVIDQQGDSADRSSDNQSKPKEDFELPPPPPPYNDRRPRPKVLSLLQGLREAVQNEPPPSQSQPPTKKKPVTEDTNANFPSATSMSSAFTAGTESTSMRVFPPTLPSNPPESSGHWENMGSPSLPLVGKEVIRVQKPRYSYSLGRSLRGPHQTESASASLSTTDRGVVTAVSSGRSLILNDSASSLFKELSDDSASTNSMKSRRAQRTSLRSGVSISKDDLAASSHILFPRARLRGQKLPRLQSVINELKEKEVIFDREAAIEGLRVRILRGEKVSHDEIKAIRSMRLPPAHRHLGWRLPWSKDLCCIKGLVHIPTPNKPAPDANSFGTVEDLRLPLGGYITEEQWGRRHYVLNLSGFLDEDISLYLEGKNRLVVRAARPAIEDSPPAVVTETILLPADLPADNLRIVRKRSGTTIIEESWRY